MSRTNGHSHGAQKLTHSMTHYLLVVHDLKETKGYARITDIAKSLELTKGSVSTAVNNLKLKGYLEEEEDSKFLVLSKKGHDEVHEILSNRALLYTFFREFLKVSEKSAREGSCLMEHLVDQEIRTRFFDFLKTLTLPDRDSQKKELISQIRGFESSLGLEQFGTVSEFVESQKSSFH